MLMSFWPDEATVWQCKSIGLTNALIHLFWEEAEYEKRTACTLCFHNDNHCWKSSCSALKRDRASTNKRPVSGIFQPFPLGCAASWCVPADLKMLTVHIWVIKESLFTSYHLNPFNNLYESATWLEPFGKSLQNNKLFNSSPLVIFYNCYDNAEAFKMP